MDFFKYKKGSLYCEGVSLESVANKYGTPVFVYSLGHFLQAYSALKAAIGKDDCLLCYSMKANSNLAILSALAQKGCGFDIVSGGELHRLKKVGADFSKVVYAGIAKTRGEIEASLRAGILQFTVESWPELKQINRVAAGLRKIARVEFRLNPDVDAKTHAYTTTGKKENKFGLPIAEAEALFEEGARLSHIDVSGIHIHIGSQITALKPFRQTVKKAVDLVKKLRKAGHKVRTVNMGGGIGIRYNKEKIPAVQRFVRALLDPFKGMGIKLILEPGRYFAGNAGVLVTEVSYLKATRWKTFAIVDAAMNDLIRPSLYGGYHEIRPVKKTKGRRRKVDVVGGICESGDFFAKDRLMVPPAAGERLALMSAGAYGFVMGGNYNSRPSAAEVLVHGKRADLVRRRQSYADLLRGEEIPVRYRVKK